MLITEQAESVVSVVAGDSVAGDSVAGDSAADGSAAGDTGSLRVKALRRSQEFL